ncbi:MAG TPA: hypothetical protein VGN95_08385 [Pyrinomonadaceae bacterium]|jgi:hypothetical protein|nr:hypothetical protein [Pyrinomonadaceae bacterium]
MLLPTNLLISLFFSASLLSIAQPGQTYNYTPASLSSPTVAIVPAPAKMPYIGRWSNGRGETLAITLRTLQFANDRPVYYRDVTKVTDGHHFSIQITSRGKINYFSKFLALSVENGEITMTLYNSYREMFDGENPQGESTWYRDK